jgi:two-component SAPR family response regulator
MLNSQKRRVATLEQQKGASTWAAIGKRAEELHTYIVEHMGANQSEREIAVAIWKLAKEKGYVTNSDIDEIIASF